MMIIWFKKKLCPGSYYSMHQFIFIVPLLMWRTFCIH